MKYKLLFLACILLASLDMFSQSPYVDAVWTNWFKRSGTGWNASDATISVTLPSGQSMLLFGDTYLNRQIDQNGGYITCSIFNSKNSAVITNGTSTFSTFLDNTFSSGVNRTPFKVGGPGSPADSPEGGFLWPARGYVYGSNAYIYFKHVNSSWAFLGGYIVKLNNLSSMTGAEDNVESVTSIGKPFDIAWGIETLVMSIVGTDYLFIYGEKNGNAYLTRTTQLNNPMNTSAWEYWNGVTFSAANTPVSICSGLSPHFSVISVSGTYYLVSQEHGGATSCALGKNIYAYKSDNGSHRGPFNVSTKKIIWAVTDNIGGSPMHTYNARVHPQFTSNGELLISYNVNGICPAECTTGTMRLADGYRPKFIRVPQSFIANLFQ